MPPEALRLRNLSLGMKLGLTGLLLTLLIGLAASAMHLVWHYENRDERPGFTKDDLVSAYHGLNAVAPLLSAVERGHPPELPDGERQVLLDWLRGSRIVEDYDNIDLGDAAPSEIIAQNCLSCHSRNATGGDPLARSLPLDRWDDIKKVAYSREIAPAPIKITAVSTHTHALSLGSLTLVLVAMAWLTSWPRRLVGGLVAIVGLALWLDISAWWLARPYDNWLASFTGPGWVSVIVAAGAVYNVGTVLLTLLVLVDVWRPARAAKEASTRGG